MYTVHCATTKVLYSESTSSQLESYFRTLLHHLLPTPSSPSHSIVSSFSFSPSFRFPIIECVRISHNLASINHSYLFINQFSTYDLIPYYLGRVMILTKQYRCLHSSSCPCTKGHLTEDVIFLVFQQLNWNPKLIATLSCVCKWFVDFAKTILWREFCKTRAPKMMLDLQSSGSHIIDGNWRALGKLLIYCCGCKRGGLFIGPEIPGHFVYRTRFSRTSGKSFLPLQCRSDVLYVSDPCEHLDQGEEGDVGFFRGIFKSFAGSKVRKLLIQKEAPLHSSEVCPYCKAKVWSMLEAKLIPQSASCRLGSYDDCIEYYVCLNGHMVGICTLLPLSDSEEAASELG